MTPPVVDPREVEFSFPGIDEDGRVMEQDQFGVALPDIDEYDSQI